MSEIDRETNFWIYIVQVKPGREKDFVEDFEKRYQEIIKKYDLKIRDLRVVYGEYDTIIMLEYEPTASKIYNSMNLASEIYGKIRKDKNVYLVELLIPVEGGRKTDE